MCSVDPDEIVEMTPATNNLDISRGNIMCRKCDEQKAVVVLRIKDAYCRDCFLSYFVHKFRSTIGKSKQIRPGDHILIAISGGASSSALLHLIRDGLDETSHKKLRFEPAFIYIDESGLSDDPDTGPEFIHQVCSDVIALDFPCYVASLEQVMSQQPSLPVLYKKDSFAQPDTKPELKEQMKLLLSSCKSDSTKQDLHEQLRREVLYHCCDSLGYSKIFLADNATTLSISILANIALGRGSQLSERVQFKAQHKSIEIYRPMREILQNEIIYYINLNSISTVEAPSLTLKCSSITSCTRDFVMGLQKEFPATIPTIFRTGDKLISTSADGSKCSTPDLNGYSDDVKSRMDNTMCAMCGSVLDTIQSEASAVNATAISQKLSCMDISKADVPNKQGVVTNNASPTCNEDVHINNKASKNTCTTDSSRNTSTNPCDCSQSKCCNSIKSDLTESSLDKPLPKKTVERYLCYGCRIILRELAEVKHLPVRVRGSVAEQERRIHMREQIQDFLL